MFTHITSKTVTSVRCFETCVNPHKRTRKTQIYQQRRGYVSDKYWYMDEKLRRSNEYINNPHDEHLYETIISG